MRGPGSDKNGGYISDASAIKNINDKLDGLTFWVHVFIPVSPESARYYNETALSDKNATHGGTLCPKPDTVGGAHLLKHARIFDVDTWRFRVSLLVQDGGGSSAQEPPLGEDRWPPIPCQKGASWGTLLREVAPGGIGSMAAHPWDSVPILRRQGTDSATMSPGASPDLNLCGVHASQVPSSTTIHSMTVMLCT